MVQNLVTKKHPTNPFRKALVLALAVALAVMMVAPANATVSMLYGNSELNHYYDRSIGTAVNATVGTVAITGNNEYLSYAMFYLKGISSSLTGTLSARLYWCNGSSMPVDDNEPLEESIDTYDVADITTSYVWVTFNFANTTLLDSAKEYTVQLVVNTTLSGVVYSDNSISGSMVLSANSNHWITHTYGTISYVYTTDTEGGVEGEEYTPPGTTTTTTYDTMITSFVAFIVPLIVMFLPALLLCFITRRVDKWLILIGLAIGAGLGYYFGMVPLWLVFLVTIGLIGMAYDSVRNH